MNKSDALKLFGGPTATARACRISKSAVSDWPEVLSERIQDRVIAGALRLGLKVPKSVLGRAKEAA